MAKTIHSGNLTFLDLTDSKKVDVHISSNLPTIQIYNPNTLSVPHSPDWASTPLVLTLTAYADSTDITHALVSTEGAIVWFRQIGAADPTIIQTNGKTLTISSNELSDVAIGKDAGVIAYICRITYNDKIFENKITFARTDIGLNGADGTSVTVDGTAYYNGVLSDEMVGQLIDLRDEMGIVLDTSAMVEGDSYIVQGYMCVYSPSNGKFICAGKLQGPKGDDAKHIVLTSSSQVFKSTSSGVAPATITVTATTINFDDTIKWAYAFNNGSFTEIVDDGQLPSGLAFDTNKKIKITVRSLSDDASSIALKASYGTIQDIVTVYRALDGEKGDAASMAFLTNENISFAANADGETYNTYMTTNVVAYTGGQKVLPTIGTIVTAGLPEGLSVYVDEGLTALADNEVVLMIAVDGGKNLGSVLSNSGDISIPVVSPISASLKLTWSKINTGATPTTFQIYAPNGYLLTPDIQSLTLQTFAYEGITEITSGATYQWYSLIGENWTTINGATNSILTVNRDDVLSACNYKCEMTYKSNIYTAVATVEDKTDTHNVLIRADARYSTDNLLYWILYATVYSDTGERDALLGPISDTAPATYTIGTYWYQIDDTARAVTLKQYDGTQWVTTDDQELKYNWFLLTDTENPVTLGTQSKVKVVTSNDFIHMCNIQCDVCDAEYELLARNNQVLIDHTDPIISATTPIDPVDSQIWIKINADGTHNICVWSAADNRWATSSADAQNKLYVEKPSQYTMGDIWVVGADYQPNGFVIGSMLKAQYSATTYSDDDWVAALSYQNTLDELASQMSIYKQVFAVDNNSLTMRAQNTDGTMSDLKATLTNDSLTFGYGDSNGTSLNHKQITTPTINITSGLNISGSTPIFNMGAFSFKIEENGSFSIVSNN